MATKGIDKLAKLKALRSNRTLTDIEVFPYYGANEYFTARIEGDQHIFIKVAFNICGANVIERERFWHSRASTASRYVMPLVDMQFRSPDGWEVPCIATPCHSATLQSVEHLPQEQFYAHLAYAAQALMDLHDETPDHAGMVQRDVKTENMVLAKDSLEIRLIDFAPSLEIGSIDKLAPSSYTRGLEPPELKAARKAYACLPGHPAQDAYSFAAAIKADHRDRYGAHMRDVLREAIEGNLARKPEQRLGMASLLEALQLCAHMSVPRSIHMSRSQYVRELVEAL